MEIGAVITDRHDRVNEKSECPFLVFIRLDIGSTDENFGREE